MLSSKSSELGARVGYKLDAIWKGPTSLLLIPQTFPIMCTKLHLCYRTHVLIILIRSKSFQELLQTKHPSMHWRKMPRHQFSLILQTFQNIRTARILIAAMSSIPRNKIPDLQVLCNFAAWPDIILMGIFAQFCEVTAKVWFIHLAKQLSACSHLQTQMELVMQ